MELSEIRQYVSNKAKEHVQTFSTLCEYHFSRKDKVFPISEKELPIPRLEWVRSFKYMVAIHWETDDPDEQNFSASIFREALLIEAQRAVIVDWRDWPKRFGHIWHVCLNSLNPFHMSCYWPEGKLKKFPQVSSDKFFERLNIHLNFPKTWKERLELDPEPTCEELMDSLLSLRLEVVDFLHKLESVRRQGAAEYWVEVHRLLELPPPPFAPKSGCFSSLFLLLAIVLMVFGGSYVILGVNLIDYVL